MSQTHKRTAAAFLEKFLIFLSEMFNPVCELAKVDVVQCANIQCTLHDANTIFFFLFAFFEKINVVLCRKLLFHLKKI